MNTLKMIFSHKTLFFTAAFALLVLGLPANVPADVSSGSGNVTLIVDYGKGSPLLEKTVPWEKPMTVLDVLTRSTTVTRENIKGYTLVTAINGVAGKRGEMAWYYSLNGSPGQTMADQQQVKTDDIILWKYLEDSCSPDEPLRNTL